MQRNWRRAVMCAVSVPTAMAVLSGCGVLGGSSKGSITLEGTAVPAAAAGASPSATASTSESASPSASPASTPKASSAAGGSGGKQGCTAGGAAIPGSADKADTADLDGDGKTDTLWLAVKGNTRMLGVETASGARFATSFTNSAPTSSTAVASRLGDGSAVILLDFSREAKLYAVADCAIVPVRNTQGQQYTFDEGFTGFGSGAGCPVIGSSGRHLVGYLAKPGGYGDGYIVTRTVINLSKGGTQALNGTVTTVGNGLPGSDPIVKTAQAVTCGAGDRATEPAS